MDESTIEVFSSAPEARDTRDTWFWRRVGAPLGDAHGPFGTRRAAERDARATDDPRGASA